MDYVIVDVDGTRAAWHPIDRFDAILMRPNAQGLVDGPDDIVMRASVCVQQAAVRHIHDDVIIAARYRKSYITAICNARTATV